MNTTTATMSSSAMVTDSARGSAPSVATCSMSRSASSITTRPSPPITSTAAIVIRCQIGRKPARGSNAAASAPASLARITPSDVSAPTKKP